MRTIDHAGTFKLGDRAVKRLGYGAMQLAGPGVFGPPGDRDAALAVLREAVAAIQPAAIDDAVRYRGPLAGDAHASGAGLAVASGS